MDLIDSLDNTFQHAHVVINGVRVEQYDDKTLCAEWSVHDLLQHMVGVVAGIGGAASGSAPSPFELAADPGAQFQAVAATTLATWKTPGILDKVVDGGPGPMPGRVLAGINLLDTAAHTWDLATATGQAAQLPDDVAAAALEVSMTTITPEIRSGRFALEVPVGADASPTDRLVAFLGRTP